MTTPLLALLLGEVAAPALAAGAAAATALTLTTPPTTTRVRRRLGAARAHGRGRAAAPTAVGRPRSGPLTSVWARMGPRSRWLTRAGVTTAGVVALGWPALVVGAVVSVLGRRLRRLRAARATAGASPLVDDIPELVALLELATAAGCTLAGALAVTTPSAPAAVQPDLRLACGRIDRGATVVEALDPLWDRWGEAGRPLLHACADHLRDGTPLLPALDRVGRDARRQRRQRAETRARRLPVLLLFPLVLCVLPAFGLLTVAPLAASTIGALDVRPLEAPASPTP